MTQVTARCSILLHGRLSQDAFGIRREVWDRRGLSGIFIPVEMAGGVRLSPMPRGPELVDRAGAAGLFSLWVSRFGDGWDNIPRYTQATEDMVPSNLVGHQSENRQQCIGLAAGFGFGQLSDRMDMAPQASACHDTPLAGAFGRYCASR